MSELTALLDYVRTQAAALTPLSSVKEAPYHFLMALVSLGLKLEEEPSRKATIRDFLEETAPQLTKAFMSFEAFGSDLADRSEVGWSDGTPQFVDLCKRRSALAFLAEIYADTSLASELDRIGQDWLDGIMRDRASHGYLDPDDIPAHMPTRHWWWWLPDDPPADPSAATPAPHSP
jgi:hypothetical protein